MYAPLPCTEENPDQAKEDSHADMGNSRQRGPAEQVRGQGREPNLAEMLCLRDSVCRDLGAKTGVKVLQLEVNDSRAEAPWVPPG